MGYKKHAWIDYGHSNAEVLKIVVKDFSGRRLDTFHCNNNQDFKRILQILKTRYGFG